LHALRVTAALALAATLMRHARDEHDEPLFLIKGGVAIELLLGLRARATKDLDAAARIAVEDIAPRLRSALAHGWEGFTFRLIGLEQVRDTAAHRGDVKASYQGDPWSTVQFEVSPTEGAAGHKIHWTGNTFVAPERLGLPSPGELPLVTIAYLIAQKLHACTDHTDPARPNAQHSGFDADALPIVDEAKLHFGDHAQYSQDHTAHRPRYRWQAPAP